jgi:hypothetical protein
MDADSAAARLQVIRTLMERSAIYRRALAPIMTFLGILGIVAGICGAVFEIDSPHRFVLYWTAIGIAGLLGAYFLTRRQALRDKEPFWSPPTRRVTLALLPPLLAGAIVGAILCATVDEPTRLSWALPVAWILLYGCALHAAGFFTPRGMRLLGWLFICGGGSVSLSSMAVDVRFPMAGGHLFMGLFFGGLQLAYGVYLHVTDKPRLEI